MKKLGLIFALSGVTAISFTAGVLTEKCYHSRHTRYVGNLRLDNSDGQRIFLEVTDINELNRAHEARLKIIRESYLTQQKQSH